MITHSRPQTLWTVSLYFNRKFRLIECERGDKPVLACSSWDARLCCAPLWRRLFANGAARGAHWRLIHAIHGAACIRPPGIDLAPMICLCNEAWSGSGRDSSVLKAFASQRAWKREEKLRAEMCEWQRAPVRCVCVSVMESRVWTWRGLAVWNLQALLVHLSLISAHSHVR